MKSDVIIAWMIMVSTHVFFLSTFLRLVCWTRQGRRILGIKREIQIGQLAKSVAELAFTVLLAGLLLFLFT